MVTLCCPTVTSDQAAVNALGIELTCSILLTFPSPYWKLDVCMAKKIKIKFPKSQ